MAMSVDLTFHSWDMPNDCWDVEGTWIGDDGRLTIDLRNKEGVEISLFMDEAMLIKLKNNLTAEVDRLLREKK